MRWRRRENDPTQDESRIDVAVTTGSIEEFTDGTEKMTDAVDESFGKGWKPLDGITVCPRMVHTASKSGRHECVMLGVVVIRM